MRKQQLTRKLTLLPGGRFAMAECDDQGRPILSVDKLPRGIAILGAEPYRYRCAQRVRSK
jgi:hypothetical protein